MKIPTNRTAASEPGSAWRISRHLFTGRPPRTLVKRPWTRPLVASIAAILLATTGAWAVRTGLWSNAKSWLAQTLIARAWRSSLATGTPVKPWPWSDSWPVARLAIPELGIERYVLSGGDEAPDHGARHLAGTALPGEAGNSVIGEPDEDDLAFLRALPEETAIEVDSMEASGIRYTVRYVQELDPRDVWITKQEGPPRLTLITCNASTARASGVPPCHAVSAYAAESEKLRKPRPTLISTGAAPASAVDQQANWTRLQNTIFGRNTRV